MRESTESHYTASSTHHTTEFHTVTGGATTRSLLRGIVLWERIKATFRRVGRAIASTVTPIGWVMLGAALVGIGVGAWRGWHEFLVFGLFAAVLLLTAVPFLFGRRSYGVEFAMERDRTVVGDDVMGVIAVTNVGKGVVLPGAIDLPLGDGVVEIAVPFLGPGALYSENVEIAAQKRGIIDVGPVKAVRGDPLRIVRREHSWNDVQTLYIHPRTVALPGSNTGFIRDLEGSPSTQLANDDLSFHAIREYVPGDPLRQVHWKSTAKHGSLMVRQYEETRRSEMMVVLAGSAEEYRDEDEFELAVSVSASIALRGMRDGRTVSVTMGGQRPKIAKSSLHLVRSIATITPRTMLDDLAGIDLLEDVTPVRQVCRHSAALSNDISIAFVVCGSTFSARQLRQLAIEFPQDIAVVVVVCEESSEPQVRKMTDLSIVNVGVLEDLSQLLLRGAAR